MESLLKSDIFFVISSIATIIITLVILIAGIYFIKIMRNFYKISSQLKKFTDNAEKGMEEIAEQVRQSPIFTFIFGKKKTKK